MDIRCPKCGEPWDNDTIHERVAELNAETVGDAGQRLVHFSYRTVAADFRKRGCAALGTDCWNGAVDTEAAEAAATLYELLGDDMDGAAAMLDDLGF